MKMFIRVLSAFLMFCLGNLNLGAEPIKSSEGAWANREFELLQNAKSRADLRSIISKLDELSVFKSACEMQNQIEAIPTRCFEYLKLRLALSKEGDSEIQTLKKSFDFACSRAASITDETNMPIKGSIPDKCYQLALVRIKINRYKAGHDF